MKTLLVTLTLAVSLLTASAARADGPSDEGSLHCRSLGVNAWVGAIFAAKAFRAFGLCRDDRTGSVFALIQDHAALGIGLGAGAGVTSARSRLELKDPSTFAKVIWHGDRSYPMKGAGMVLDVGMGGCFGVFYERGPCENGNRNLGAGLGIYTGIDSAGSPAMNRYMLLKLTPGMKWLKSPPAAPKKVAAVQPNEETDSSDAGGEAGSVR